MKLYHHGYRAYINLLYQLIISTYYIGIYEVSYIPTFCGFILPMLISPNLLHSAALQMRILCEHPTVGEFVKKRWDIPQRRWFKMENPSKNEWVGGNPISGNLHLASMANMEVSWNRGAPKSSILVGLSIKNHPFWGPPMTMETSIIASIGYPGRLEDHVLCRICSDSKHIIIGHCRVLLPRCKPRS